MSNLPWMKLYIGDELANTSHMTPAEFGSYMLLKMHYWRFGSLPSDDSRLAMIAKVRIEQWYEIRPSIEILFEDGWQNPKLEEQRSEAEERHKKLSEAGKKGGRPRKEEKRGCKPGFSSQKAWPKQSEPESEPDPYSGIDPDQEPDSRAYEGGRKDTDTRESMFTPFPIPGSPNEGRDFLASKGVPSSYLDECLRKMMQGDFSEYDLEGVLDKARSAA
jgi:uncharacterized protein YdaU (DUF1376 family)